MKEYTWVQECKTNNRILTFLKEGCYLSQYEHTVFTLSAQSLVFLSSHYGPNAGVKYKTHFFGQHLYYRRICIITKSKLLTMNISLVNKMKKRNRM